MNLTPQQKQHVRNIADQAAGMMKNARIWLEQTGCRNDFYTGAAIGLRSAAKQDAIFFNFQNKFTSKLNQ